jgi:transposase-like protein
MGNPFRYFNSSPEIAVMMYVKYPLSLRNVEDLLSERGIALYPRSPSSARAAIP